MDEIYANVEYVKSQVSIRPSTPAPGPSSPRSRPHVAVAVSLGLLSVLLLAGLVCLGVLMHASAAELSSIKANLTERLQVSGDMLSSVSAERDQLKDNFTALKDNFTALKDNFTALTQEKDGLQLLLKQKKTCPEGWTMFRGSCYLLSTRDGSWENGRKDCRDQGADLVIIDSLEEQKFLSSINRRRSWIGLSDKDIEGTWKWIDGTPLTAAYWYRDANVVEPNNGGGGSTVEEDCAEMNPDLKTQNSWNDLPCNTALRWIYSQPVAVAVKFLSSIIKSQTWIGLSDRDIEGTWKWIDGTLLTAAYWSTQPNGPQPDNRGGDPRWGEEDCAHIELEQNPQRNWNDLRCDAVMRWICEKLP